MMMATETAQDTADTHLCGPVTEDEIGSNDIPFDGFYTLQYKIFPMLLRNMFHSSSEWVTLVLEGAEVAGLKEHVSYMVWLRDFCIRATDEGRGNRAFTEQL